METRKPLNIEHLLSAMTKLNKSIEDLKLLQEQKTKKALTEVFIRFGSVSTVEKIQKFGVPKTVFLGSELYPKLYDILSPYMEVKLHSNPEYKHTLIFSWA